MNGLQNRGDGEDIPLAVFERRAPIQTIIVDSEAFDRITRNDIGPENLTAIGSLVGQLTTLSTVLRPKSISSLRGAAEVTPGITKSSIKTPESKPALPIVEPTTKTVVPTGYIRPVTSLHSHLIPNQNTRHVHGGTPTTSVTHRVPTSAHSKPGNQHHNVTGIIVGLVAAGVTSAIILLVGLFFFCRYKRKRELAKNGGGDSGKSRFGIGAKRSASQNSAESKRKLLTRTTTVEKSDGGSEDFQEHWKPDETVHYPPYQHIPRNLGSDLVTSLDQCDRTNRAVSPSSADTPLPEPPIRPSTIEIRNPPLRHRPSLPVRFLPLFPSPGNVAGLTRPPTAYGNNAPGRYSMAPPLQSDRKVRRSSTKTHEKPPSATPRGRAYTLTTIGSPERLSLPAGNTDMHSSASSTRSSSHSPTPGLSRRTSASSQRYSVFPKAEKRGFVDGPAPSNTLNGNTLGLYIPSSGSNTARPGMSRATSYSSLREDASGIPTVWMNGTESPKASPTGSRGECRNQPPVELQTLQPSRKSAKLQVAIPESPVYGTVTSVSTTNSSILDLFKRNSGPLPLPEKSPLRATSPGRSTNSNSPPSTRNPSPCRTENSSSDSSELEIPAKMRRRNTGYKPNRLPSESPPPALPIPTVGIRKNSSKAQVTEESVADELRSHNTMSLGTWSQSKYSANTNKESRPHSYSTNTTLSMASLGIKGKFNTRFSVSPIYEIHDSGKINAPSRDSALPTTNSQLEGQSTEEALDSFFQATQGETDTARPSLEEIDIEPQLARCISITSTSGSCRTTIDFKPSAESLHSRMLSKSTIRTMDMHLEDVDLETCTDIEDATATPILSRSNSIASGYPSSRRRPSQLRGLTDSIDTSISVISSAYSPTLSMVNFYSSSSPRYSMTVGPPSSRSPIAARRNSIIPNISIPQPKLYIHPNTQLEVTHIYEPNSGSANPAGGSLSSAPSPLSFTTAESSEASYSPPLNAGVGAPMPLSMPIPIPTPQIYSSSQEDLSQMNAHGVLRRQGSYLSFNPGKSYGDLNSALSLATGPILLGKPSMNSLAVNSLAGGRMDLYGIGRSVSAGTISTLDKSSFRDLDLDKSASSPSNLLESSDESSSNTGSGGTSDASESAVGSPCEKRRIRSLGAVSTLKRKRSTFMRDERGRSRERKLV